MSDKNDQKPSARSNGPLTYQDLADFTEQVLLPAVDRMIEEKLDVKLKPIYEELSFLRGRVFQMEERLEKVEKRLTGVEEKLERIASGYNEDIVAMNEEIRHLKEKVKKLEDRLKEIDS